jgi:NAD(P)-dependent dehydrogenase (short-subunit alcohol dehydrogenase family)
MKTALISGFTSGMGLVTAKALAPDYELILIGRNAQKCEHVLAELRAQTPSLKAHVYLADLSNMKSVKQVAEKIKQAHTKIDVLINNAGLFIPTAQTSADGFELTLANNHFSYFLLTRELLPLLKQVPAARIVNVASEAGKIGKYEPNNINLTQEFSGMKAYCNSKLFNIMFTYELARKLSGTNITVNAMHPGGVNTNFGNSVNGFVGFLFKKLGFLMRTPEQGADTIIWLATSPEVEGKSGLYVKDRKPIRSNQTSYNTQACEQLWKQTEELIEAALAR